MTSEKVGETTSFGMGKLHQFSSGDLVESDVEIIFNFLFDGVIC